MKATSSSSTVTQSTLSNVSPFTYPLIEYTKSESISFSAQQLVKAPIRLFPIAINLHLSVAISRNAFSGAPELYKLSIQYIYSQYVYLRKCCRYHICSLISQPLTGIAATRSESRPREANKSLSDVNAVNGGTCQLVNRPLNTLHICHIYGVRYAGVAQGSRAVESPGPERGQRIFKHFYAARVLLRNSSYAMTNLSDRIVSPTSTDAQRIVVFSSLLPLFPILFSVLCSAFSVVSSVLALKFSLLFSFSGFCFAFVLTTLHKCFDRLSFDYRIDK